MLFSFTDWMKWNKFLLHYSKTLNKPCLCFWSKFKHLIMKLFAPIWSVTTQQTNIECKWASKADSGCFWKKVEFRDFTNLKKATTGVARHKTVFWRKHTVHCALRQKFLVIRSCPRGLEGMKKKKNFSITGGLVFANSKRIQLAEIMYIFCTWHTRLI